MKRTYSNHPIEDNMKNLPRVPSGWSATNVVILNWFKLFSFIALIGAIIWLGTPLVIGTS